MVNLTITPPLLSAIEAIPPTRRKDLDLDLPDTESLSLGKPISHEQIIQISRYFREKHICTSDSQNVNGDEDENAKADRSLNALLRGTKLFIPPPPPKPEPVRFSVSPSTYLTQLTPEYLAHKARLLAAYEEDAYTRMLHNPSTHTSATKPSPSTNSNPFDPRTSKLASLHDRHASLEDPSYKDPLTPSLVLNIFLSVLITGFAVYWALSSFSTPEFLTSSVVRSWSSSSSTAAVEAAGRGRGTVLGGGLGVSEPVRVLLSLFAAIGVGIVEVAIYAIYLGKIEDARGREKKIKERKEVLGPIEAGHGDKAGVKIDEGREADKEKEVIWGRGPNGGLRRRVRERWEENEVTKDKEDGIGDEDEKTKDR
ncbi:endoplasmic reticulum-based factor for assembly of V-ATPase-domain-containing protein [Aspergillus filifer]